MDFFIKEKTPRENRTEQNRQKRAQAYYFYDYQSDEYYIFLVYHYSRYFFNIYSDNTDGEKLDFRMEDA